MKVSYFHKKLPKLIPQLEKEKEQQISLVAKHSKGKWSHFSKFSLQRDTIVVPSGHVPVIQNKNNSVPMILS